jgi:predicted aspartyl protease
MKNRSYSRLAIRVALFYFTLGGVCQGIRAQAEIHFRLAHGALVIVPVMAGKEGPFDFLLDTGADTSIVDPSITPLLSIAPAGSIEQTTLAGTQKLTTGWIPSLSIGSIQAANVPVLVQDLSELRKMDSRIVGIVGEDFLSRFNYMLEYDQRVLRFEKKNEIQDSVEGERLTIETKANRMFVRSEAQSERSANLRLLLDTAANSVVLLYEASQSLQLPIEASGLEATSSGHIGLQTARMDGLLVGSERFHDLPVALPAAEPAEDIGDGLLPTVLFHTLYINSRERFVILNPRPKKK